MPNQPNLTQIQPFEDIDSLGRFWLIELFCDKIYVFVWKGEGGGIHISLAVILKGIYISLCVITVTPAFGFMQLTPGLRKTGNEVSFCVSPL